MKRNIVYTTARWPISYFGRYMAYISEKVESKPIPFDNGYACAVVESLTEQEYNNYRKEVALLEAKVKSNTIKGKSVYIHSSCELPKRRAAYFLKEKGMVIKRDINKADTVVIPRIQKTIANNSLSITNKFYKMGKDDDVCYVPEGITYTEFYKNGYIPLDEVIDLVCTWSGKCVNTVMSTIEIAEIMKSSRNVIFEESLQTEGSNNLDEDSFYTIDKLLNSRIQDNINLAVQMLCAYDFKTNELYLKVLFSKHQSTISSACSRNVELKWFYNKAIAAGYYQYNYFGFISSSHLSNPTDKILLKEFNSEFTRRIGNDVPGISGKSFQLTVL